MEYNREKEDQNM